MTKFCRLLQLLFYRVRETFLKLNRTHNARVAHRRAEHPTNSLRFNSNGIMGNRITNSQDIMEKMHNKEYQLYFADGDSRRKKDVKRGVCFWCMVSIFHKDLKDYPTEQIEMAFFLIAQWLNVPVQNTNTFVEAHRRHARNFW